MFEASARKARSERVRGFGKLLADRSEKGCGEVAERIVSEGVGRGPELTTDQASENCGYDGSNLRDD